MADQLETIAVDGYAGIEYHAGWITSNDEDSEAIALKSSASELVLHLTENGRQFRHAGTTSVSNGKATFQVNVIEVAKDAVTVFVSVETEGKTVQAGTLNIPIGATDTFWVTPKVPSLSHQNDDERVGVVVHVHQKSRNEAGD